MPVRCDHVSWYATPANSTWYAWAESQSTTTTTPSIQSCTAEWMAWTTSTSTTSTTATMLHVDWEPESDEIRERRRARAEAEARARIAAAEAAELLLGSCLSPEQRAQLAEGDYFEVRAIGPDGQGTTYRIERGSVGNVFELDGEGRKVRGFCIHPADVPEGDAMLAQMLMIRHAHEDFRRIANIRQLRGSA